MNRNLLSIPVTLVIVATLSSESLTKALILFTSVKNKPSPSISLIKSDLKVTVLLNHGFSIIKSNTMMSLSVELMVSSIISMISRFSIASSLSGKSATIFPMSNYFPKSLPNTLSNYPSILYTILPSPKEPKRPTITLEEVNLMISLLLLLKSSFSLNNHKKLQNEMKQK